MDVRKIINDTFLGKVKAENVDENTPINKLGLDSLDLMEALMDLEEKFGFEFSDEEVAEVKSVKDVYELVEKKVK